MEILTLQLQMDQEEVNVFYVFFVPWIFNTKICEKTQNTNNILC